MPDEKPVELLFPIQGIDVSCEFGRQPKATTPTAVNVRGYEPTTDRQRGGSRSGLDKLSETTVGGLASVIQHLAVIVDPTTLGLGAAFDAVIAPGPNIPDPSTNNAAGGSTDPDDPLVRNPDRTVRDGGSGVQPNRHLPRARNIEYVQKIEGSAFNINPLTLDAIFGSPIVSGRLLIVAVWTTYTDPQDFNSNVAVTNGSGTPYLQIGGGGGYVTANGGSFPIAGTSTSYSFDSNVSTANLFTTVFCSNGSQGITWQDDIGFGPDFADTGSGFTLGAAEAAAVARYGPPAGFGVPSYYQSLVVHTAGGCISNGPVDARLSLWYRVAAGVAGDTTARVTSGGSTLTGQMRVAALEYKNNHATPLTAQGSNTAITPTTTTPGAGSVTLNGTSGQAVIAAFLTEYEFGSAALWTPGSGYNARIGAASDYAMLEDRLNLSGSGSQSPTITTTTPVLQGGIVAAFKKA